MQLKYSVLRHLLSVEFFGVVARVWVDIVEVVEVDGVGRYVVHLYAGRVLQVTHVLVNELPQCVQVLTTTTRHLPLVCSI